MMSATLYASKHHDEVLIPAGRSGLVDVKRLMDIVLSLAALVVLAPLMIVIVVALLIADGRPVFFRQSRIGRNGKAFVCLKFRSMSKDADRQLRHLLETCSASRTEWMLSHKLRNDPRIHIVGRFLRRTNLDELPQLFNVLKGEMSVIGPRPIVQEEVSRYGESFSYYTAVRPGLSGLWQVSGRNALSYDERVALDVAYVKTRSFLQDVRIIAKTCAIMIKANGDH